MVTRTHRASGQAIVLLALLSMPAFLSAESGTAQDKQRAAMSWESVEMFAAMEAGDINVKLVAKSDRQAQIHIKNNTDRALSVRLPEAFAGVPVAAQFFPLPAQGPRIQRTSSNNRNNKQPQIIGSGVGQNRGNGNPFGNNFGNNLGNGIGQGFGQLQGIGQGQGMNRGNGIGFPGNGVFNVAPEAEGKFLVEAVCLEHGKPGPRSTIPYEIRKIETVSTDPVLQEFLKRFGRNQGQVNHEAAQAAAWHLADHLSWQTLAEKRVEHANGAGERYFSANDIKAAMKLAEQAGEKPAPKSARPAFPAIIQVR